MPRQTKVVLIVDDEPDFILLTRMRLKAEGFNVWEAANIEEALKLVQQKPDLILLDVKLPGNSGFKICKRLKGDKNYGQIPIILISALGTEQQVKEGIIAGGNAFLTKPFDFKLLIRLIRQYMS